MMSRVPPLFIVNASRALLLHHHLFNVLLIRSVLPPCFILFLESGAIILQ